MLYSYRGEYPNELPNRIRLSDGRTVTDKATFTAAEILDAGYVPVSDPPTINAYEELSWNGIDWAVTGLTDQQKLDRTWASIRELRDGTISSVQWRIDRYLSEVRQGIPPKDNIQALDTYIQALRDITKQSDPYNIVWPEVP